MTVTALLTDLARQGFKLKADGGQVLCAPVSHLTPELREAIKAHKTEILDLLSNRAHIEADARARLSTQTQEALTLRFAVCEGVDNTEVCRPAIDFYIHAGRWPEAFFMASLIQSAEARQEAIASITRAQTQRSG